MAKLTGIIPRNKRYKSKYFKKVTGILIIGFVIYFLVQYYSSSPKDNISNNTFSHKSSDRVIMKGMRITESIGDRPSFTAEIKRVRFEHKKIGFLRFGMLPVAVVEGFKLTVFDTGTKDPHPSNKVHKIAQPDKLRVLKEIERYVSSPEFLKLFKLDRAHNMRFESFYFKIVKRGKDFLTVKCRRLVPDIANNVLKLSGNVSVVAKDKKVEGESFSFDWKKNRLFSDQEYKLTYDKHMVKGRKLDTDIFLSSL